MGDAHARERLVEAALKLFHRDGFPATDIDAVVAEAGVAKTAFETHFKSKDDLIVAVMQKRAEAYRRWLSSEVKQRASDPCERLLACFDAAAEWVASDDFAGCACINTSAEFTDLHDPIHAHAARHKNLLTDYLAGLARAAKLTAPSTVARQLLILIDGAMALVQVTGRHTAVADAKKMAVLVIEAAQKSGPAVGDGAGDGRDPEDAHPA